MDKESSSSLPSTNYDRYVHTKKRKSDHEHFVNRAPTKNQRKPTADQDNGSDIHQPPSYQHSQQPGRPVVAQLAALDAKGQRVPGRRPQQQQPFTSQSFAVLPNVASQNVDRRGPADVVYVNNGDELSYDGGEEEAPEWELVDMSGDPTKLVVARRGKLVTFYRNGDPHFKGLATSVSHKAFLTFETLLVWLNEKIQTTAGVKYIFSLPEGNEIRDIGQFVGGRSYVVSSVRKIINVPYGDQKERFWKNRSVAMNAGEHLPMINGGDVINGPSGSGEGSAPLERRPAPRTNPALDGNALQSTRRAVEATPRPLSYQGDYNTTGNPRPRILIIKSNTDRSSQQKVIFNPHTSQTYEEVLVDIKNMLNIQFPPVTALFMAAPPYTKVLGISHLSRDLRLCNEFLACGREMLPLELQQQTVEPLGRRIASPVARVNPMQSVKTTRYDGYDRDTDGLIADLEDWKLQHVGPGATRLSLQPDLKHQADRKLTVKPYRKAVPDVEDVKVYIQGHLREFYSSRYGSNGHDPSLPDKKLVLNWVYGYRGRDARNNLYVLPSGELVYNVAAIVVVHDVAQEKQRHYTEHTEDITCIAVHPARNEPLVATGQLMGRSRDSRAHIRIWDPKTLMTFIVLGLDLFAGGISSICFSEQSGESATDGTYLMAVDDCDKKTITVWDWRARRVIARTMTTSTDSVYWATFHPHDFTTIISFGRQQVNFWKLFWEPDKTPSIGRLLRDKHSGAFEADQIPNTVTSVAFALNGDVITGDMSGRIFVWVKDNSEAYAIDGRTSDGLRHAHEKPVSVLCMLNDGTLISGGGTEIKAWDSMNYFRYLKERSLPEGCGCVGAAVPSRPGGVDGSLYIGTTSNVILHGSLQDKIVPVLQGHCEELWAVASHPSETQFVTAGYDQWVTAWNADRHRRLWRTQVEKPCVSAAYDPSGRCIAIGTTVGRFIVLDANTGGHWVSVQLGTESLDVLRFSPDSKFLAVGCQDSQIYIYEAIDDFRAFRRYKNGILKGHENFVSQLDWSRDGRHLQSVSGDYDLLVWNVLEMAEVSPKTTRDLAWMTQTCTLGYDVMGAWSNLRDGDDINTASRSNGANYLAVGNSRGSICFYRYPCTAERPEHDEHKVCSGHVTAVAFVGADDKFLVTSGGNDAAVMQWSLVDRPEVGVYD